MELVLSGIGAFIDCLVLLFFYYRVRKSVTKDNSFFYFFERFTLFFGLFYLFFSVPLLLFPHNSSIIGWGYLIGHIFAYIGFGYLSRVTWLIAKPSFNSSILFKAYLVLGAALTALNLYLFNSPIVQSGIADWDQNPLVATLIIVLGLTVFLPAAVLFIRESIRQPKNRKRYMLIGISFLMIILSGPLHDIATIAVLGDVTTTTIVLLFADAITTSAFLLMFWGVMSGIKTTNIRSN